MKRINILVLALCSFMAAGAQTPEDNARTPHASQWLQPVNRGTVVPFDYNGAGTEYTVLWGMDTAWDNVGNVVCGTNAIGKENMGYGRISFQPNDLLTDKGELTAAQKTALRNRIAHIKLTGVTDVLLNCDHEALNDRNGIANYKGYPDRWYRLIKASVQYAEKLGMKIVSIAPFNEPDYTDWHEGSMEDFRAIAKYIKEDDDLKHIRVSAGNTLNCDRAREWYEYMKPYVDEGNTHQLAGSFKNYADFFTLVRKDGNFATGDELHNVMEAMVGIEYGMQAGIWWGWDGVARGDFCRANRPGGARLGYGENRDAWSAASVYRRPDGTVQAFLGTSERQATNSTYQFVSTGGDVYYDGKGPMRAFSMDMPGGTGYQKGQTNAERMVYINRGDDVPPLSLLDGGTFVIMNKKSKKAISVQNNNVASGTMLVQNSYNPSRPQQYMQWIVDPVDSRVGGDFSYAYLRNARNRNLLVDVWNWSNEEGGSLNLFKGEGGTNEMYYFEYAGDGFYIIRSRYSGLCFEVSGGSGTNGATLRQAFYTGEPKQLWRFLPVDAALELNAPAAPTGLKAVPLPASVRLSWNANEETDLDCYQVLRGIRQSDETIDWSVIGPRVSGTVFIDNTCESGQDYIYKVCAMDRSLNRSEGSELVEARATGEHALIAHYAFIDTLIDATENQFDAVVCGDDAYMHVQKKVGAGSFNFNQTNYLLLPHEVANQQEMTIAFWIYWRGGSSWQRVFDFGNGSDQYMFLTPGSGSDMRFVIKNGAEEQMLTTNKLSTNRWKHVAVTLSDAGAKLYVDGELKAESADVTIRPSDFRPGLNYLGCSQFASDPLLNGYLDDLRVYNYALSADELAGVMEDLDWVVPVISVDADDIVSTEYYSTSGLRLSHPQRGINIVRIRRADGRLEQRKFMQR